MAFPEIQITVNLAGMKPKVPCYLRPRGFAGSGITLSRDVSFINLEVEISSADFAASYFFEVHVNGTPVGNLLMGDATLKPGDTMFVQSLNGVARVGDVVNVRMMSPGSSHLAPFEVVATLKMVQANVPPRPWLGPVDLVGWDEDPFGLERVTA